MTDESQSGSEEPRLLALEDFTAASFEAPLASLERVDSYALAEAFGVAQSRALGTGAAIEAQVFELLRVLCDLPLRTTDPADVWGSRVMNLQGRTVTPSDLGKPLVEVLAQVAALATHSGLKARLCDVVWSNDRTRRAMADTAIEAYQACADGLMDGTLRPQFELPNANLMAALEKVRRGLQIARAVTKKRERPVQMLPVLQRLYDAARAADSAYVPFKEAALLGLNYEFFDPIAVASDAEAVASAPVEKPYPMAAKILWDLAAHLFDQHGDQEAKRRCQLRAVDQILAMRAEVSTAGAEASWVMDALQALLHVDDVDKLAEQLRLDLRRLQQKSLNEMATIPVDMDMEAERDEVADLFMGLSLAKALREFALLATSPPVEGLRRQALASIEGSPVMATMAAALIDGKGRTAAHVPGLDAGEGPSEAWYAHTIERSEVFRRLEAVTGYIEPARLVLSQRFTIGPQHFAPIVGRSPFVARDQEWLMALGFARLVQGDMMSAAHLLIPQLEPCMRHILSVAGEDPAKRFNDATEEDLSLSGLFERMRPKLETIFTADIAAEIERTFDLRPGPRLRHEMAHGQLGSAGCFDPSVVYGCWLLYRLTCLFVMREWETIIAPAIDAEC